MTTKTRCLVLAVMPLLFAGCYKRTPLQNPTPDPSTRVVATLTDSGIVAMGNALGAGALEVEGVVTKADENQWTLEMVRVDHRDGHSQSWNHEAVSFPRRALTNPFVISLDKTRSWLTAAGVVVGAIAIARAFDLFGADEDTSTPPPPPASVVPIIRGGRR